MRQVAGLPDVLRRMDVRNVLLPIIYHDTPAYNAFLVAVEDSGAEVVVPFAGYEFTLGDATVTVLSPNPTDFTIANQGTSSTPVPSPAPFVARPRGARATVVDDSTVYAICRLCQNKIMSNRLSNLTSHVRRHATLKQFHCVYCVYAHHETGKVNSKIVFCFFFFFCF